MLAHNFYTNAIWVSVTLTSHNFVEKLVLMVGNIMINIRNLIRNRNELLDFIKSLIL